MSVNFDTFPTFMASSSAFTPGATPQDVFAITGNATTNVYVLKMGISTNQTTAGSNVWNIAKRSAANTGGTHAAPTAVPFNSNMAAASATLLQYTANPTAGTLIGNMWSGFVNAPAPATAGIGGYTGTEIDFLANDTYGGPVALLTAAEVLSWNFGGAALPTGLSVLAWVMWAESPKV